MVANITWSGFKFSEGGKGGDGAAVRILHWSTRAGLAQEKTKALTQTGALNSFKRSFCNGHPTPAFVKCCLPAWGVRMGQRRSSGRAVGNVPGETGAVDPRGWTTSIPAAARLAAGQRGAEATPRPFFFFLNLLISQALAGFPRLTTHFFK